jgi:hypothetical protein
VTATTGCVGAQPTSSTLGPAGAPEVVPDGVDEPDGAVMAPPPPAPATEGAPVAEALAEVSHTSSGRTRASPRCTRSQSMRPSASCFTDCTR